jgi:hypothetical protein
MRARRWYHLQVVEAASYLRLLETLGAEIVLDGGQRGGDHSRYRLTGLEWLVPATARRRIAAGLLE